MKVFHYDPETAKKGAPIGDIPYCHATSNDSGVNPLLPLRPGQEWRAADRAEYLDGSPIRFDLPVCFCLGELRCGTDVAWHWVVLMPARTTATVFTNYYCHHDCPVDPGIVWNDEWDCACNDHCPACDREIEPYKSEEHHEKP